MRPTAFWSPCPSTRRQDDVRQTELLEFCRRIVAHLIEKRGFRLEDLVRFKYQLAKAVERRVTEYRQQALDRGYQRALFGSGAAVEASLGAALAFRFNGKSYAPSWPYTGRHQFQKSYVLPVGELKSSGEEFDCAQAIDSLPAVKHWIRNLAGPGRQDTSFRLPTSTDRFYPDFVAELTDGRTLVVEYKGESYATNDDSASCGRKRAASAACSCSPRSPTRRAATCAPSLRRRSAPG